MAMLTRLTNSGTTTVAPGSPKALQRLQNCIAGFLWPALQAPGNPQHQLVQRKSTQLDVIDCFTNDLVQRKTQKWEQLRENLNKQSTQKKTKDADVSTAGSFSSSVQLMSKSVVSDIKALTTTPQLGLDIRSLSQAQLDNLLLATLEVKNKLDFLYLIRQSIRWQQLPSNDVLIACLKYLSSLSRLAQIESFAEICRSKNHPYTKTYADLAPFKAMAMWRSGSSDIALYTLQRGYGDCCESDDGRRMARIAFRTIAEETLGQKSEAVLVSLMEVARAIYNEHKDIFVIACVWKQCFVSNWFCDQSTATDLFDHYTDLQQIVGKRSSSLCSSFLARHNVDAVHRLIEVFLQYNQRESCSNCLSLLFNYQYLRKDLRACAEIIKSCSELEMPLSEMQNEQFLTLFLSQSDPQKELHTNSTRDIKPKPHKEFQYQF